MEIVAGVVGFVIGGPIILAGFVLFLMMARGAIAPNRVRNRAIERMGKK